MPRHQPGHGADPRMNYVLLATMVHGYSRACEQSKEVLNHVSMGKKSYEIATFLSDRQDSLKFRRKLLKHPYNLNHKEDN